MSVKKVRKKNFGKFFSSLISTKEIIKVKKIIENSFISLLKNKKFDKNEIEKISCVPPLAEIVQ